MTDHQIWTTFGRNVLLPGLLHGTAAEGALMPTLLNRASTGPHHASQGSPIHVRVGAPSTEMAPSVPPRVAVSSLIAPIWVVGRYPQGEGHESLYIDHLVPLVRCQLSLEQDMKVNVDSRMAEDRSTI